MVIKVSDLKKVKTMMENLISHNSYYVYSESLKTINELLKPVEESIKSDDQILIYSMIHKEKNKHLKCPRCDNEVCLIDNENICLNCGVVIY